MNGIIIQSAKQVIPKIYAYTTPEVRKHNGWLKIGFTGRDVETQDNEQTYLVGVDYKTWWHMCAAYMTEPLGTFRDKDAKFFETHVKEMD